MSTTESAADLDSRLDHAILQMRCIVDSLDENISTTGYGVMKYNWIHQRMDIVRTDSNQDKIMALLLNRDEATELIGRLESLLLSTKLIATESMVAAVVAEEDQAISDRMEALRLSGRDRPQLATVNSQASDLSRGLNRSEEVDRSGTLHALDPILISTLREVEAFWRSMKLVECIACSDRFSIGTCMKGQCEHFYCTACTIDLFRSATSDETLYPPRCCRQPLPTDDADKLLPSDVSRLFKEKSIEFSTPPAKRIYCSNAKCSIFIKLEKTPHNEATCPACSVKTCTICKAAAHVGNCPEDPALKKLLEKAKEEGWQRCYSCKALVEISHGCNHMTCRCKAQFCYECGTKWKNCNCAQWDESRLEAHATRRVGRRRNGGNIEAEAARLRARHDCTHEPGFAFHHGADTCEMCTEDMPVFTLECRHCGLRICRRCRDNRL